MENMTFRSRLVQLMQKSRKALRLYSTVERFPNDNAAELAEVQVAEWRRVNTELLRELNLALEHPNQRRMVAEVFGVRDQFYGEWKLSEADLVRKQRQLIDCSEAGDFIKASMLAKELVMLKARVQACQAAHHEVSDLITRSHVSQPNIDLQELEQEPIVEPQPIVVEEAEPEEEVRIAKVIPLRKRV